MDVSEAVPQYSMDWKISVWEENGCTYGKLWMKTNRKSSGHGTLEEW